MALTKRQIQKYRTNTSDGESGKTKAQLFSDKYKKLEDEKKEKETADIAEREAYAKELTKKVEEQKEKERTAKIVDELESKTVPFNAQFGANTNTVELTTPSEQQVAQQQAAIGSYNNRMMNPQSQVAKKDSLTTALSNIPVNIQKNSTNTLKSLEDAETDVAQAMQNQYAVDQFNKTGELPGLPETDLTKITTEKKEETVLPGVTRPYTQTEQQVGQLQATISELNEKKNDVLYRKSQARGTAHQELANEANEIQKEIDTLQKELDSIVSPESNDATAEENDLPLWQKVANTATYTAGRFGVGAGSTVENWASALQNTLGDLATQGEYSNDQNKLYTYLSEHPEMRRQLYVSGAGQSYAQQKVADAAGVSLDTVKNYVRTSGTEDLREGLEDIEGVSDLWRNSAGNWAESIGQQLPGMMLGAGGVSEGASAATKALSENATLGSIGASVYGQTLEQLGRERGFDTANYVNATLQGAIEVGTEKMGFTGLESLTNPVAATGNTKKSVGRAILSYLANGAEEGLEEVINAPLSEIADRITGISDNQNIVGAGGIFDASEMVEGGASGFAVGMIMGGVGSIAGIVNTVKESNDIKQAVEDLRTLQNEYPPAYRAEIPTDLNSITTETIDNILAEQMRLFEQLEEDVIDGNVKYGATPDSEQVVTNENTDPGQDPAVVNKDTDNTVSDTNNTVNDTNDTVVDTDNTISDTNNTTDNTENIETETVEDTVEDEDSDYDYAEDEISTYADEDSDMAKALRTVNVNPVNARNTLLEAYNNDAKAAVDALYEEGRRITSEGGDSVQERLAQVEKLRDSVLANSSKLSEEGTQRLTKAFRQYGIKNVIVDSKLVTDAGDTLTNAMYDPATKTIHVSPLLGTDAAMAAYATHELVHHTATADSNIVSDIIAAKDSLVNAGVMDAEMFNLDRYISAYSDVIQTYGQSAEGRAAVQKYIDSGVDAETAKYRVVEDYINEEIAGDFMAELANEPDIAKKLTADNRNFIQKIYDAIVDFINKLRGKEDVQKYQHLADTLRSILSEKTGETVKTKKVDGVKNSGIANKVSETQETNAERQKEQPTDKPEAAETESKNKTDTLEEQKAKTESKANGKEDTDTKSSGTFAERIAGWEDTPEGTKIPINGIREDGAIGALGISVDDITFDTDSVAKWEQRRSKSKLYVSVTDQRIIDHIPDVLNSPMVVTNYGTDSLVVYGDVALSGNKSKTVEIVMHKDGDGYTVASVGEFKSKTITKTGLTDVLYLNPNESATVAWFKEHDLELPYGGEQFGVVGETAGSEDVRFSKQLPPLSEAQEKYFADSKIRCGENGRYDEYGELLPVYHATDAEFTVFDRDKLGKFTDGNATDISYAATAHLGFWFNTQDLHDKNVNPHNTYTRSEQVYLNIENPIEFDSVDTLAEYLNGYSGNSPQEIADACREDLENDWYDGIVIKHDSEFGGMSFVAFDSNQIKKVDNINPTTDEDIRFSRDVLSQAEKDNIRLREQKEYYKQQLAIKGISDVAVSVSPSARHKVSSDVASKLPGVSTSSVLEVVDSVYKVLDRPKKSGETINSRIEEAMSVAYEGSKELVENAVEKRTNPLYESMADLKRTLRETRLYNSVSESEFGGAEDYKEWKKGVRNLIKLTNDESALPIDSFYQELCETNPELFPADITNPADQLKHIGEVAESLKGLSKTEEVSSFEGLEEQVATEMANELVMGYFTNAKITESAKRANKANADKQKTVEKITNKKDAEIKKLKEENKQLHKTAERAIGSSMERQQTSEERNAEIQRLKEENRQLRETAEKAIGSSMNRQETITGKEAEIKRLKEQNKQTQKTAEKAIGSSMERQQTIEEQNAEIKKLKEENKQLHDTAERALGAAFERQQAARNEKILENLTGELYKRVDKLNAQVDKITQKAVKKDNRLALATERKKFETTLKKLNEEVTRPTKKLSVPETLRSAVAEMLLNFKDTETKTKNPVNEETLTKIMNSVEDNRIDLGGNDGDNNNSDSKNSIQDNFRATLQEKVNVLKAAWELVEGKQSEIDRKLSLLDDVPKTKAEVENADGYVTPLTKTEVNSDISALKTELDQLKTDYYHTANDILAMVNKYINQQNKIFIDGKWQDVDVYADSVIGDLTGKRRYKDSINNDSANTSAGAIFRDKVRGFGRSMAYESMNASLFFHAMGETGDAFERRLREGGDKVEKLKSAYENRMLEVTGGTYDTTKASGVGNRRVTLNIGDSTVDASKAQLMSLYLLWKRKDARRHLQSQGACFLDKSGNEFTSRTFVIDEDIMREVRSKLSEKDIEVADAIGQFLSNECSKAGNDATLEVYGFAAFLEDNYFPMDVATGAKLKDAPVWGVSNVSTTLEDVGFMKHVDPRSTCALRIGNVFDVAEAHVAKMAAFSGYAPVLSDMQKVFRRTDVREAMLHGMGKEGVQYLNDFLKKANQNELKAAGKSNTYAPFGYLGNMAKRNAVMFNASTTVKQLTSIYRAGTEIEWKYLYRAFTLPFRRQDANTEYSRAFHRMTENSGVARMKIEGNSDTGFGKEMRQSWDKSYVNSNGIVRSTLNSNDVTRGVVRGYDKFTDLGMKAAAKADETTLVRIWKASELKVNELYSNLTAEQKMEKTVEIFENVVGRTQVVDSLLDAAPFKDRLSGLGSVFGVFMNEPMKTFGNLCVAVERFKDGKPGSGKHLANVIGSILVSNVIVEPLISAMFSGWRDEEDDSEQALRKLLKNYVGIDLTDGSEGTEPIDVLSSNVVQGIAGIIPVFGEVYEIFTNTMQGYSSGTDMGVGLAEDVIESTAALLNPELNSKTKIKKISDFVSVTAQLCGIPYNRFAKGVGSAIRNTMSATDNYLARWEFNKIWYRLENTSARSYKYFYDIMADAYKAGDTEAYAIMRKELSEVINDSGSVGVSASTITNAIEKRGGKIEVGSDLWYIDLQAGFDLDSFNTSMKVEKMITAVYSATNEDSILPSSISNSFTVNKETVKIEDPIEYQAFAEEAGDFSYMILTNMESSDAYKKLDDQQKVYAIKQAYAYARKRARKNYNSAYDFNNKTYTELYEDGATPATVAKEILSKAEDKEYSEDEDE